MSPQDDRSHFKGHPRRAKIAVNPVGRIRKRTSETNELPEWTKILNDVLRTMHRWHDAALQPNLKDHFGFLGIGPPVPFEELLLPFVGTAIERLSTATSNQYLSYPEEVRLKFERALLQKLSSISSRVLMVEFRAFLAYQQVSGGLYPLQDSGNNTREYYLRFVDEMYTSSWKGLLLEYAVLARFLAVTIAQWVRNTAEFLQRFELDLPEIRSAFLPKGDPGTLIDVQCGLSDPHNGGRSVLFVKFKSGAGLIYKPRNMKLEAEYFEFVGWINDVANLLPFPRLKILQREDYGWSEYVRSVECGDEQAVHRFYVRSGMFLCLVYVLNGIDFHFENVIAAGENPVPVDLETIFHQATEYPMEDAELTDVLAQRLRESVLRAHILPNVIKRNKQYFDISAISRSRESVEDFEFPVWKNVNADKMDYRYERTAGRAADNLPRLRGEFCSPDVYTGDIVDGFEALYRFLLAAKENLIKEGGRLHQLFQQESRFIFRPTSFYDSILWKILEPDCLRDGTRSGILLDLLGQRFATLETTAKVWPILREEITALWELDIPKFTVRGTSTSLGLISGGSFDGYFSRSIWDRVQQRIHGLNDEDLQWQIALIRAAMDAREATRLISDGVGIAPGPYHTGKNIGREELVRHAVSLGEALRQSAIFSNGGDAGWLTLTYLNEANQFALQAINLDLYNGRSGIALFFAALESVVPGAGFRELAYSTSAFIRRRIRKAKPKDIRLMGIGGYLGIPSLIYALTRIGEFLNDRDLLEDAKYAVSLIDQEMIECDEGNDVLSGTAGAILALLACRSALGDSEIIPRAVACGIRLLQTRTLDKYGFRTWAGRDGTHLTGFSHGTSGIAYALLRLYRETMDKQFYDAAIEALGLENAEFVPEENNWPDHRPLVHAQRVPAPPAFKIAWCQGAPGIGLARLATLDLNDSDRVRADIQAALSTTAIGNLLSRDHLCCGNAGLAETLLFAGIKLSSEEWQQKALQIAGRMITRAEEAGSFAVRFKNGFLNPTLFQGAAGVGYQFLRMAYPDRLPSVLLLE